MVNKIKFLKKGNELMLHLQEQTDLFIFSIIDCLLGYGRKVNMTMSNKK